jgi:hypothetical protein
MLYSNVFGENRYSISLNYVTVRIRITAQSPSRTVVLEALEHPGGEDAGRCCDRPYHRLRSGAVVYWYCLERRCRAVTFGNAVPFEWLRMPA